MCLIEELAFCGSANSANDHTVHGLDLGGTSLLISALETGHFSLLREQHFTNFPKNSLELLSAWLIELLTTNQPNTKVSSYGSHQRHGEKK